MVRGRSLFFLFFLTMANLRRRLKRSNRTMEAKEEQELKITLGIKLQGEARQEITQTRRPWETPLGTKAATVAALCRP